MSSEMRMHDDEGRCLCGCTENCAVVAELRGEITRLSAVVARMVAEDNERFASEALIARQATEVAPAEAGADGAVWMYRHAKRGGPWSTFHNEQHRANTERDPTWEVRAFYPHPQDASAEAVMEIIEKSGQKYLCLSEGKSKVLLDCPVGTRFYAYPPKEKE